MLCASGCLPRERFNKNCEWTGDSAFPLDLQSAPDQHHLVEDAQLAEELAVRYADFKHGELFGYEGHGGLLQHGKVGNDCLAQLDAIIEANHGVTHEQIGDARIRRDRWFDLAVLLSFGVLYAFGAMWACRWLARRFSENGPRFWAAAIMLSSVVVSVAGVQLLGMWATTVEMFRIGNDHLGPRRGALIPWTQHFSELFIGGVVVFLTAALVAHRVTSDDPDVPADRSGAHGVVLH
jgi:hypothetical protein